MAMLYVYKRVTKKEIKQDIKAAIPQITEWFEANPKRRVCRVNMWYDRCLSIKRNKDIKAQLQAYADQLEAEGRVM